MLRRLIIPKQETYRSEFQWLRIWLQFRPHTPTQAHHCLPILKLITHRKEQAIILQYTSQLPTATPSKSRSKREGFTRNNMNRICIQLSSSDTAKYFIKTHSSNKKCFVPESNFHLKFVITQWTSVPTTQSAHQSLPMPKLVTHRYSNIAMYILNFQPQFPTATPSKNL